MGRLLAAHFPRRLSPSIKSQHVVLKVSVRDDADSNGPEDRKKLLVHREGPVIRISL